MSTLVRQSNWQPLEKLAAQENVQTRFKQVLGERAPQFIASMISLGNTMLDVEPKSILGSCMQAAVLDLPIEKSLGFAWVVPYRNKTGLRVAQFQMGYKGYIQLALRTGQYSRMNASTVNAEALEGYDEIGEPRINWEKLDPSKPARGYVFAFKMVNGFTKVCYWPKEKVIAHAERYSQAYRTAIRDNDKGSPWVSEFDKMGIKTVIINELSGWGALSVQWQRAKQLDQSITMDIDATATVVENPFDETDNTGNQGNPGGTEGVSGATSKPKRTRRQVETQAGPSVSGPEPPTPPPQQEGPELSTDVSGEETLSPQEAVQKLALDNGFDFTTVQKWGVASGIIAEAASYPDFGAIPTDTCARLLRATAGFLDGLRKYKV